MLNKETEAINIVGDSMVPLIKEDSIVFINKGINNIVDSGIYLFSYEDQLQLKVLARSIDDENIIKKAVSLNTIYPMVEMQISDVKILGKFIYSS